MKDLQTGPDQGGRPGSGAAKVELLKGDEYLRVWIQIAGA